jgi:alpha-mannosidase
MISRSLFLLLALCFLPACMLTAQDKIRVYLANDDHTDFFWSANAETYHKVFLETLDYYIDRADETADEPASWQSRWNCDGSYWMWIYEKNRSGKQFRRLISKIRDGHISVPLTALSVCLGATPAEGVIRGMYYPGKIGRQYNVEFPLAYQIENQTLAYGLGALWAGAGAKYSWTGICNCDTRIRDLDRRENYIYWWVGPDSSRVLMKWYPMILGGMSFGSYAEARQIGRVNQFLGNPDLRGQYPYRIIGLFGKGWDDLETMTREFMIASRYEQRDSIQYIVSNETDFFRDFEENYGDVLPSQSLGFGNEWELYTAYMQETTSRMLRSIEKLRSAEALASLVSLEDRRFMEPFISSRDSAWMNIGLFWEHDWGMVHREYFVPERISWQNGITAQVENYVDRLYDEARERLGRMIAKEGGNPRYFVFNPLGFERDDVADLPCTGNCPVKVIDVFSGEEVPAQVVGEGEGTRVQIMARSIPPAGYKVFEVMEAEGQAFEHVGKWDGRQLETPFYRATFSGNGSITSLVEKSTHREWARAIDGRTINDLGESSGTVILERNGCVSATIRIESPLPLQHTTRITFYGAIPRIDIQNEITENFEGNFEWTFSFNLDDPQVWHEEVGAIVRADLYENGGYLSSRNARYDWLTLGHFADVGDGRQGITISSPDCNFMQLGNSSVDRLDTKTPQLKILAGADSIAGSSSRPFIRNQGGADHFLQRFALVTHNGFRKSDAMRFSLAHQNPLVCGEVMGGKVLPVDRYALIRIDHPDVLLWALKPAEDGFAEEGLVARLWNMSGRDEHFHLSTTDKMVRAKRMTHLENPVHDIEVHNNQLSSTIKHQQLATYSFFLERN